MVALQTRPIRVKPESDVELDVDQRAVVAHHGGPMLVLAGPGTGKTTTLVAAVLARLRGEGHDPVPASRVLVLTFGRLAAAQLRRRLASGIGDGMAPTVATFHSFANGVLRRASGPGSAGGARRLLNAAEQEHRLREIFLNAVREKRVAWPPELAAALGTKGLTVALREFLSQVRRLGLSNADLASAAESGPKVWSGIVPLFTEYFDVLAAEGVLDYDELINAATEQIRRLPARSYDAIYVDEYQDTDPAQVRMLQSLVAPSTTLVAVGDPDQAIYAFRGADVRGILNFREDFVGPDGQCAELAVLRHSRRFGVAVRDGAGAVIRRVPLGGLPVEIQRCHRSPVVIPKSKDGPDPADAFERDAVRVLRFDSQAQHSLGVADIVGQAMRRGWVTRWSQIAVIVRSGVRDIGSLRSALGAAQVPVEIAGDDLLLRDQPALVALLSLLRVAAGMDELSGQAALALAQSRLGGLSVDEVRDLGRTLRHRAISGHTFGRTHGDADGGCAVQREVESSVTDSAELIAAAVVDPTRLQGVGGSAAKKLAVLARLFGTVRTAIADQVAVSDVLWMVWNHNGEPERLRTQALAGGTLGHAADQALDAAIALFDLAARMDESGDGGRGVRAFLHEVGQQQIPGGHEHAVPEGAARRDCVRLLTAHRAKGLEWDLVVVAGVQEDAWPDLRRRPSLLETDQLTEWATGRSAGFADALADERRLFYVACTRARTRLVVTCVAATDDSGPQPSRFVGELAAGAGVEVVHGDELVGLPLTLPALVARLRHLLGDPEASPSLRAAAASRLERLRERLPSSHSSLVDPERWWGSRSFTDGPQPLVALDQPVPVSGSMWTALEACPLGWFLSRHLHAEPPTGVASAFGSVVHALADAVARGELAPDTQALTEAVGQVWPAIMFEADWQRQAELREAVKALERFAQWHQARPDRKLLASETPFVTEVETPAGIAQIRGRVDRLEQGPNGLHVIDLKTQRRPVPAAKLAQHRQLALYQLAADAGAVVEPGGDQPSQVLTAELVQLRQEDPKLGGPRVQVQSKIESAEVVADLAEVVAAVRGENFEPSAGASCRYCSFGILCHASVAGREVGA